MTSLLWQSLIAAACVRLVRTSSFDAVLPSFPISVLPPSFEVWTEGNSAPKSQRALSFPLKGTNVRAEVAGGVVYARVTQTYRNDGQDCLQSRYIFPLPTKAAISAMSMRIGNRTVAGQIRTRAQARHDFNEARDAGQSASLLDQERPNVFAMELANILPGETTEVTVDYAETLSPTDGVYAFTFPAVVGPRYGVGWAPGADTSDLTTQVNLTVAPSCVGVDTPFQQMQLTNTTKSTRAVLSGSNADIVVKFWFTERTASAHFLVSQKDTERYFTLAVEPPQRRLLSPTQIAKREYLFILDVSGSMRGYPIDLSKILMRKLLKENVRSGDSLNIMLFAGASAVLSPSGNMEATPANIDYAQRWLDRNMFAGGGTELLPALQLAFALPRFNTVVARTIVVMTDGYVTVEREAFDLVRTKMGEGNVFVFGIGNSVNRYLIEGLARVGYGEPFVVTDENDGQEKVEQLKRYIDTPVLTGLSLTFNGGFQPREQEPPFLPDVFASRPITLVGKWDGALSGRLKLQGRLADGERWEYSKELSDVEVTELPAVPLLWARSRIAVLGDYALVGDEAERKITDLGLEFSLMTAYTSFVAVDSDPSGPAMCGSNNSRPQEVSRPDIGPNSYDVGSGSFSYFPESGTVRLPVKMFSFCTSIVIGTLF